MRRDQAANLREKFSALDLNAESATGGVRAISFTSGKGGVGKTNTVVNLAIQLARMGKKIFLVDADLGLANIDIILGISPKYTIEDVLTGKRNINDVLVEGPEGIHVLPAASGLSEMSELTKGQQMKMFTELSKLQSRYDYFLIDTGAGISSNVLRFNASADKICVVTTPEPTAMTDAYALMKLMATRYQVSQFNLIVNKADLKEGKAVHKLLESVCRRYLPIKLIFSGNIPRDKNILAAVKKQVPVSQLLPGSEASRSFAQLARRLDANPGQSFQADDPSSFWRRVGLWKRKTS